MTRHGLVPIQHISPRAIQTREQYRGVNRKKAVGKVQQNDQNPKLVIDGATMTNCSNSNKQSLDLSAVLEGHQTSSGRDAKPSKGTSRELNRLRHTLQAKASQHGQKTIFPESSKYSTDQSYAMTAKFGHTLLPLTGNMVDLQQVGSIITPGSILSSVAREIQSNPASKAASQVINLKPATSDRETKTLSHTSPTQSISDEKSAIVQMDLCPDLKSSQQVIELNQCQREQNNRTVFKKSVEPPKIEYQESIDIVQETRQIQIRQNPTNVSQREIPAQKTKAVTQPLGSDIGANILVQKEVEENGFNSQNQIPSQLQDSIYLSEYQDDPVEPRNHTNEFQVDQQNFEDMFAVCLKKKHQGSQIEITRMQNKEESKRPYSLTEGLTEQEIRDIKQTTEIVLSQLVNKNGSKKATTVDRFRAKRASESLKQPSLTQPGGFVKSSRDKTNSYLLSRQAPHRLDKIKTAGNSQKRKVDDAGSSIGKDLESRSRSISNRHGSTETQDQTVGTDVFDKSITVTQKQQQATSVQRSPAMTGLFDPSIVVQKKHIQSRSREAQIMRKLMTKRRINYKEQLLNYSQMQLQQQLAPVQQSPAFSTINTAIATRRSSNQDDLAQPSKTSNISCSPARHNHKDQMQKVLIEDSRLNYIWREEPGKKWVSQRPRQPIQIPMKIPQIGLNLVTNQGNAEKIHQTHSPKFDRITPKKLNQLVFQHSYGNKNAAQSPMSMQTSVQSPPLWRPTLQSGGKSPTLRATHQIHIKGHQNYKMNQDLMEFEGSQGEKEQSVKKMQESIIISRLDNDKNRCAYNDSVATQKNNALGDMVNSTLTAHIDKQDKLETEYSNIGQTAEQDPSVYIKGGDSVNTQYLKRASGDYHQAAQEAAMLDSTKSTKTLTKNQSPESNYPFLKLSANLDKRDPETPTRKDKKSKKDQAHNFHIRLSANAGKEVLCQERSLLLNLTPPNRDEEHTPKSHLNKDLRVMVGQLFYKINSLVFLSFYSFHSLLSVSAT